MADIADPNDYEPVANPNDFDVVTPLSTPRSGVESANAYGQTLGAPTIEEQKQMVEDLPPAIRNPLQAAAETVSGLVPKSIGELGQFAGSFIPPVQGVEDIGRGAGMLKDVLFGTPINEATATAFPETQILPQVEQTAPFSKERYKAGFDTLAQLGMAAAVGRGITPKPLTETLFGKEVSPEVAAVNESLAQLESSSAKATEDLQGAQPNAVQEPSTGEILQRQPEETGIAGGERVGVEPSVQGQETPEARQGTEAQPQEVAQQPAPEEPATPPAEPKPEIPPDAKATVQFKTDTGDYVSREMNAREAEGIFTKEKSSYKALIDCLGR